MEEQKQKKNIKPWVKLTIIFSSIIVGITLILCGAIGYFRLPVNDYYKASEKAFIIPEISDGYVPQGMCYDQVSEYFILSGYINDGSPSPLYLSNKDGTKQKKVTLFTPDNQTYYDSHGCGVDIWKE